MYTSFQPSSLPTVPSLTPQQCRLLPFPKPILLTKTVNFQSPALTNSFYFSEQLQMINSQKSSN